MAAPIHKVVSSLRNMLLELKPSDIGLAPTDELLTVWGAFFDGAVGGDVLMVNGLADQTSSLYMASGRAVIGTGYLTPVHAATIAFLVAVEDALPTFTPSDRTDLPEEGAVTFTALTFSGRRRAGALVSELRSDDHPLASVWAAGCTLRDQLAVATVVVSSPGFQEVAEHPIVRFNANPPA